jgi:aspartyl-tRNA(Asn)/glutamyl-tRNA(Gln) amidotransferase subunit C
VAIERAEVERIAELARLHLEPERIEQVTAQLSRVLEFVETLNQLDLEGCEPGEVAATADSLRDDHVNGRRLGTDLAVANAPETEAGFFLVPPVVDHLEP